MRADRTRHLSAVFLDRDGVISRKAPEGDYVKSWEDFLFLPDALDGLRLLAALEVPVLVATNQRGIARGRVSEAVVGEIHRRMREEVAAAGGRIDAVYHCPHEGGCDCRKPATGMFEAAARDWSIELSRSAVVGDRASDMHAAKAIGALRILVGNFGEVVPAVDHRAGGLEAAARWLADQGLRASAISE